MRLKVLLGTGLAATILVAGAGPALAHVTTDPDSAPKGAEVTLRFRVPNEVTGANVVKVDVAFPTDHPLLGVDPEPVPGWTVAVSEIKLSPPVSTDDGPVAQAVSEIAWTATGGAGTPPGQFQEFPLLVQRLPSDTDQAVFKVVQTYGDGMVVRWIDPVLSGQAAPDHPTPILKLTTTGGGGGPAASTTVTSLDLSHLAQKPSVSAASTRGTIAIALGALSLIAALVALTRRRGAAASP